ncbi:MAG TPA: prepilin-type N-terminal cleavage/methylation domain-containing protein [Nitrospirales bacterium]|jgi:general secretion pathway protein J|nr:prepilin-type N-terminal cleavage/methylation domain-containing protein [Nitrospirales bacterium]HIA13692.1 prepilin-type N-terminal cleavage/methylation domain-containing protein [Nitrospirales bacterium]HIB53371.1 prepilin-type N-terminal cleavage/methylation domain-containing protein [Nitrospirales bacterium]HIN33392.1 prepilin-type N-terminal cleavage/methylation domain-containing protein [Nitrospirales bacterium]HIO70166.1 prepilin-type N-terminal cleavage/methylation domain-containing 
MIHSSRHLNGFTLIEVLLAMAMVAILFTLLYGTFGSSSDLIQAAEQEGESYHMARLTVRQLSHELTSVVQSVNGVVFRATEGAGCPQIARFEFMDAGGFEDKGGIGFVAVDAEEDDRPVDCLTFATYAHGRYRPDAKESDLSVVTYWLDGDKVMHEEETNLFSLSSKSVESYPLAEGVEGMNFKFFDGAQWVDEWDAGEQDVLPQAVEVELRFVLPSEERRVFTTMISVARAPE